MLQWEAVPLKITILMDHFPAFDNYAKWKWTQRSIILPGERYLDRRLKHSCLWLEDSAKDQE